jgi:hypothetical protein
MMNASLDQYMRGLEEAVERLPELLARWSDVDSELRTEYAAQLEWMLEAREQAELLATKEGRVFEIAARLARATGMLIGLSSQLQARMRISGAALVPSAVIVSSGEPAANSNGPQVARRRVALAA